MEIFEFRNMKRNVVLSTISVLVVFHVVWSSCPAAFPTIVGLVLRQQLLPGLASGHHPGNAGPDDLCWRGLLSVPSSSVAPDSRLSQKLLVVLGLLGDVIILHAVGHALPL